MQFRLTKILLLSCLAGSWACDDDDQSPYNDGDLGDSTVEDAANQTGDAAQTQDGSTAHEADGGEDQFEACRIAFTGEKALKLGDDLTLKAEVLPEIEGMKVSFVMGEDDACKAAPTPDWKEIASSNNEAVFTHQDRLSVSKDVCFAVKVLIGDEYYYCDQKVSEDSDGIADGYQPENALQATLYDFCGGCQPETACEGKQIMAKKGICDDSGDKPVCKLAESLSVAETCDDDEVCSMGAAGASCEPCPCSAAITCDANDNSKGSKTLNTCNAEGVCNTQAFTCSQKVFCIDEPAGIKTSQGKCSATAEDGCSYEEGTVEPCVVDASGSCNGQVVTKTVAFCKEDPTPACGSEVITKDCNTEGKLCIESDCAAPEIITKVACLDSNCNADDRTLIWDLANETLKIGVDLKIPGVTDKTSGVDSLNDQMKVRIAYRHVFESAWAYADVTGGSNVSSSQTSSGGATSDSDNTQAPDVGFDRYIATIQRTDEMVQTWSSDGVYARLQVSFDGGTTYLDGESISIYIQNPCFTGSMPLCAKGIGKTCLGDDLVQTSGRCKIIDGSASCDVETRRCGGVGEEFHHTCGTGSDKNSIFTEGTHCIIVDAEQQIATCEPVATPLEQCPYRTGSTCTVDEQGNVYVVNNQGCLAGQCVQEMTNATYMLGDGTFSTCLIGFKGELNQLKCIDGKMSLGWEMTDCALSNQVCVDTSDESAPIARCRDPEPISWCRFKNPLTMEVYKNDHKLLFKGDLKIPNLTGNSFAPLDAEGKIPMEDSGFEYDRSRAVTESHALERMSNFRAELVYAEAEDNLDLSKLSEAELKKIPLEINHNSYVNKINEFIKEISIADRDEFTVESTWAFAYRFSLDGGETWTYCDGDENTDESAGYQVASQGTLKILDTNSSLCAEKDCPEVNLRCEDYSYPNVFRYLVRQTGGCHIEGGEAICDIEKTDCTTIVSGHHYQCDSNGRSVDSMGVCDYDHPECKVGIHVEDDCTVPEIACTDSNDAAIITNRVCDATTGQCKADTIADEPCVARTICRDSIEYHYSAASCVDGAGCNQQFESKTNCEPGKLIACEASENEGEIVLHRSSRTCNSQGDGCATTTEIVKPALHCSADRVHYDLYKPFCVDGTHFDYTREGTHSCPENTFCIDGACGNPPEPDESFQFEFPYFGGTFDFSGWKNLPEGSTWEISSEYDTVQGGTFALNDGKLTMSLEPMRFGEYQLLITTPDGPSFKTTISIYEVPSWVQFVEGQQSFTIFKELDGYKPWSNIDDISFSILFGISYEYTSLSDDDSVEGGRIQSKICYSPIASSADNEGNPQAESEPTCVNTTCKYDYCTASLGQQTLSPGSYEVWAEITGDSGRHWFKAGYGEGDVESIYNLPRVDFSGSYVSHTPVFTVESSSVQSFVLTTKTLTGNAGFTTPQPSSPDGEDEGISAILTLSDSSITVDENALTVLLLYKEKSRTIWNGQQGFAKIETEGLSTKFSGLAFKRLEPGAYDFKLQISLDYGQTWINSEQGNLYVAPYLYFTTFRAKQVGGAFDYYFVVENATHEDVKVSDCSIVISTNYADPIIRALPNANTEFPAIAAIYASDHGDQVDGKPTYAIDLSDIEITDDVAFDLQCNLSEDAEYPYWMVMDRLGGQNDYWEFVDYGMRQERYWTRADGHRSGYPDGFVADPDACFENCHDITAGPMGISWFESNVGNDAEADYLWTTPALDLKPVSNR